MIQGCGVGTGLKKVNQASAFSQLTISTADFNMSFYQNRFERQCTTLVSSTLKRKEKKF
jgi:hypothetical protein